MADNPYPTCDKCGKQHGDVMCYEGFGVGIRLCKGVCDREYLAKIKTKNEQHADVINGYLAGQVILLNMEGEPTLSEAQQGALNLIKKKSKYKIAEEVVAYKNKVKAVK